MQLALGVAVNRMLSLGGITNGYNDLNTYSYLGYYCFLDGVLGTASPSCYLSDAFFFCRY